MSDREILVLYETIATLHRKAKIQERDLPTKEQLECFEQLKALRPETCRAAEMKIDAHFFLYELDPRLYELMKMVLKDCFSSTERR